MPKDQTSRLRRCSTLLYEAYECALAPEDEITNKTMDAANATWQAYVAVRKLLGDKGPFGNDAK